jgi:hypothetical protein
VLVALSAIVPGAFVVVTMMIAIIFAFSRPAVAARDKG